MKKSGLLSLSLLLFSVHAFSQHRDNIWILGYDSIYHVQTGRTTIDFNSGSPAISFGYRSLNLSASSPTIADENGNLLFYTNGIFISNARDTTMVNGDWLNPSFYTGANIDFGLEMNQSAVILPYPGDTSKYYLFHCTIDTFSSHAAEYTRYLYYSIVDMTLDNGLGAVISKNNILLDDSINQGGISAVRHGNGRDWWVVCHQLNSNQFIKYLVTPDSIIGPFRQNIGSHREGYGPQSVFSRDGNKFAMHDGFYDLDVIDFDRCTGVFSNCVHVSFGNSSIIGGVAFSSTGQVLYATKDSWVWQFDLTSANIPASQIMIATWDSTYDPQPPFATYFWICKLAPDNKIYISTGNTTRHLHVINYPDSLGLACDLVQHGLAIPTYYDNSLPNHPNYNLQAWGGSICDTLGLPNGIYSISSEINDVLVFPNPTTRLLYATLHKKFPMKDVLITNGLGDIFSLPFSFTKNGEYLEVNTSALSQGVYFLELLSEKERIVKRFVKE